MFFVSKKKYNELLKQKEDFERIATDAVAQNGRLLDEWDAAIKEMKSIQALNHQLVSHNDELLARCKELEVELQMTRQDIQQWTDDFEELDLAYGRLETDCDRLREERDHYEERCRYLEDELTHYEAEEEGKYLTKEAE